MCSSPNSSAPLLQFIHVKSIHMLVQRRGPLMLASASRQYLLAELSAAATRPQRLIQSPERRHHWPAGGTEAAQGSKGSEERRAKRQCFAAEAAGGCSASQDAAGVQPLAGPAAELQQQVALLQQRLEQASAVAVELQQAHAATGDGNAEKLQQRQQARPLCLTVGMSVATCSSAVAAMHALPTVFHRLADGLERPCLLGWTGCITKYVL